MTIAMQEEYAYPEVLVSTGWVSEHLNDSHVRVAEVDYDPSPNYYTGHVPGAVLFDWRKDMNDPVARDILSKNQVQDLLGRNGISNSNLLILYGDFNNWFAAYAFWTLKYYGEDNVRIMNGGRKKWILEDRKMERTIPSYQSAIFEAKDPNETIRVYRDYVKQAIMKDDMILIDVRGPKEFTGEILAPPEYPTEHAQRGGHIPGAKNIPWAQAVNDSDGTFRGRRDLEELYRSKGITKDKEIITYCRIGERSSHTWFALTYLLGFPNVKNYDGSWTEWGNSVKLPIEK